LGRDGTHEGGSAAIQSGDQSQHSMDLGVREFITALDALDAFDAG
jgi:hypothetical protein